MTVFKKLFFSCCSCLIYLNNFYILLFNLIFLFSSFSFSFFSPYFILFSPCLLICFVFFALFPNWHSALILFSSLSFNWLCFQLVNIIFGFLCLPSQSLVLSFLWNIFVMFVYVLSMCMCICSTVFVIICLICIYHLSGFVFCFFQCFVIHLCVFVLIPFNAITNNLRNLSPLTRDWA